MTNLVKSLSKKSLDYTFAEYDAEEAQQLAEHEEEQGRASLAIPRIYAEGQETIHEAKKFRKKFGFFRHLRKKPTNQEVKWKREIEMDEHTIELDVLVERFGTNLETGLTEKDAATSIALHGQNKLTPAKQLHPILKFFKHVFAGFNRLLWLGAILCFFTLILDSSNSGNLALGVVLIGVIFLGSTFEFMQEAKTSKVMKGFENLAPTQATVIRDGHARSVNAEDLTLGDIVEVKAGNKVPADIRIISSASMKVDNSSLTGESEPQERVDHPTNENPLETKNLAFFSSLVTDGNARGVVVNIGDSTVIGRIAQMASAETAVETPLHKDISRFVKILSIAAISIGLTFFAIGFAFYGFADNLAFAIGIIVANVPEGLPPTITLSLTLTAKKLAKKMVRAKNLEGVETLGSTSTICSDKTGTLTLNRMTVSHIWANNTIYDKDEAAKLPLDPTKAFYYLHRIGALCNRAVFDKHAKNPDGSPKTIGDASESALLRFCDSLRETLEHRAANPKVAEIVFNSTTKYQVSVHIQENKEDKRFLVVMKGAPEKVIHKCTTMLLETPNGLERVPLNDELKEKFTKTYEKLGGFGERVLGFAERYLDETKFDDHYQFDTSDPAHPNFPVEEMCFVGLYSLIDPPHPNVPESIRLCQSAGIRVIMVTGDHPITARAISKQVGIITADTVEDIAEREGCAVGDVDPSRAEAKVVEGSQLLVMTPEELDEILEKYKQVIFARTTPEQKLKIVEACQRREEVVAVTGDGVNDSPALKKADIGVAMGINGSDVSKEAADMILMDDNFASIVSAVEEGRLIFDNLKKSVAYTLTSNVPESVPFLLFILIRIPLPIPTLLILCIDLVADLIPAISLAYEKKESDIMKRGPRKVKTDRLIDGPLLFYGYVQLGLLQCLSGFFTYFMVFSDFGFEPGDLFFVGTDWEDDKVMRFGGREFTKDERIEAQENAQTAYFVSILMMQSMILFVCKTRRLTLFRNIRQGLLGNKMLLFGFFQIYAVAVLIVYVPWLNDILGSTSIKGIYWLYPLPFMLLVLLYDEARKFLIRRYPQSRFSRIFAW